MRGYSPARVFAGIEPEQFRNCFMDWVNSVSQLTQGEVIALDGKTLRRSHGRPSGKAAIHMVSAWASENSLVLGQGIGSGQSGGEIQ